MLLPTQNRVSSCKTFIKMFSSCSTAFKAIIESLNQTLLRMKKQLWIINQFKVQCAPNFAKKIRNFYIVASAVENEIFPLGDQLPDIDLNLTLAGNHTDLDQLLCLHVHLDSLVIYERKGPSTWREIETSVIQFVDEFFWMLSHARQDSVLATNKVQLISNSTML